MKEIYDAVIRLDKVFGAAILDEAGNSLYDPLELNRIPSMETGAGWRDLVGSSLLARELDLIFDRGRIYIRKLGDAYLLVLMDPEGSAASLSLTCDLFPPISLGKTKKKGLFSRFSRN